MGSEVARQHQEQSAHLNGFAATMPASSRRLTFSWPGFLLLTSGCGILTGPTIADAAKARATIDLNCPSDNIGTYRAAGGSVVARGCGAWTQYACFYSRREPVCTPEPAARVVPDAASNP